MFVLMIKYIDQLRNKQIGGRAVFEGIEAQYRFMCSVCGYAQLKAVTEFLRHISISTQWNESRVDQTSLYELRKVRNAGSF